MTTTHGGARPKIRDDDGRTNNGGANRGQGRKPSKFTMKLGDKLAVSVKDQDGNPVSYYQLWTVADVTRTHLTLSSDNGDTIRMRR